MSSRYLHVLSLNFLKRHNTTDSDRYNRCSRAAGAAASLESARVPSLGTEIILNHPRYTLFFLPSSSLFPPPNFLFPKLLFPRHSRKHGEHLDERVAGRDSIKLRRTRPGERERERERELLLSNYIRARGAIGRNFLSPFESRLESRHFHRPESYRFDSRVSRFRHARETTPLVNVYGYLYRCSFSRSLRETSRSKIHAASSPRLLRADESRSLPGDRYRPALPPS